MGMASVLARGGVWVCGFVSDVDGSRSFGTCGLGWVNCWSNVGIIKMRGQFVFLQQIIYF